MDVKKRIARLHYEVPMPDRRKRLRELIVYISDTCQEDPNFGATKLNKILFHSDFKSFARYGKPITGERYQRLERGPAPKRLLPERSKLQEDGAIALRRVHFAGGYQDRIIPLRDPDLSIFSGQEIALVDEIIDELWDKTAAEVSTESHGIVWRTRYDGDLIPYEAAFLSEEPITLGDISRTEELAHKFQWNAG